MTILILFFIVTYFYKFAIKLASPFNKKAKLWNEGHVDVLEHLKEEVKNHKNIIWFHCASLGEFEQGKPLMSKIKKQNPQISILITFFSPSGFEVKKNDPIADIVSYLPMDSPKNSKAFVEIVKPMAAIFIKYEYWYGYMKQLHDHNIPFYYVSCIFRPSQIFFKNRGKWFANQLRNATGFFVQNEESKNLLHSIDIDQVIISGDTRFDRVYETANQDFSLDFVEKFYNDKKLLIAGSTWPQDESLLEDLYRNYSASYKIIIAPHVVDEKRVMSVKNLFKDYRVACYSERDNVNLQDYDVLIIDTIGILGKIYKYSTVSYVGGAFHTGLHNVLEPAVFGRPIFFGPHYAKFNEAICLVQLGGAFTIRSAEEMNEVMLHFENDSNYYLSVCNICKQFVNDNLGAVDIIYDTLKTSLPLV